MKGGMPTREQLVCGERIRGLVNSGLDLVLILIAPEVCYVKDLVADV